MQPDEPNLPQGWRLSSGGYYHWTDPEESDSPDIYIDGSDERWDVENWHISYRVRDIRQWNSTLVPLTPEPPFELARALYYAAQ